MYRVLVATSENGQTLAGHHAMNGPRMLDLDACYAAMTARDARFDGLFFVGVATTGVYCRPVCPARTPRRDRCSFHRSAAEAERSGFRACFRCRPELAPGHSTIDALPRLVRSAAALIDDGFLNEHGVDALAASLGVTARHLRRATEEQLGVSPIELAQTRRLALAKQLLQDTDLGLAELAHASGFRSVRRFNALFLARFGRAPSELRRTHAPTGAGLTLRLDHREPFDWPRLLAFLAARAIPGVEQILDDTYQRVVHLGGHTGLIKLRPLRSTSIHAEISLSLAPVLMPLVVRLRRLLDLDADPRRVADVLSRDSTLAPLLARRPGLRVPGTVDSFETAMRAVLGQQVSVRAATTLAGRLVTRLGVPIPNPTDGLTHRFPTPTELASVPISELAAIGLPATRAATLHTVADAFAQGMIPGPSTDPETFVAALTRLPGIGDWTAQYLALRALHHPDAFPAGDLVLRKALGNISEKAAITRAEPWRPWRAYAVMHLWTAHNEGLS